MLTNYCFSHSFQIVMRETRQRCTIYSLTGQEEGCTAFVVTARLLDDRNCLSKGQSSCVLFKITQCIGQSKYHRIIYTSLFILYKVFELIGYWSDING